MAVTVTYKGATLTTVTNETKVLETAGTWVEDDFTLTDVSGGGGYSIDEFADGTISGAISLTTTNIRARAFKECNSITSVTAPNVTVLREQIFSTCTGLTSISFGGATSVNSTQQFLACTALTSVDLPELAVPAGNMFQGCTSLEFIDFPKVERMNVSRLFYGCNKFKTIVLRHSAVVAINNDVFTNTPFAGYNGLTGTAYVPQSLISSYQTASNWSTLYSGGTCSFVAIEGSIYE